MYRREKPLALKSSTSALANNLSALITPEKDSLNYAVVHKSVVNIISSTTDGSSVTNKQVICKEPAATHQTTPMILQCKWVQLPVRTVLVLTTLRGIQIYEYDGSAMVYFHALGNVHSSDASEYGNFGRGITSVGENFLCVGTQLGEIAVFDIPSKGTNVNSKDSLTGHKQPICDLASEDNTLVSCDEQGTIIVWSLRDTSIRQREIIKGTGDPCSCLCIWKNIIVGGFSNGQLRLYSANTGRLAAAVNAHVRWVNALDIAKDSGLLLSVSDDTHARVWKLKPGDNPEIEHCFGESVTDMQLCGGQFVHKQGWGFCVTGYDSSDLVFYIKN
ncbi:LOW QUALITY PROTEIN: WD repeat-containing protein 54-like [Pecten maximus]|uniref:LOW QUALITY PROTEIN: WD repeat-containing protein 54-like n=1 Tax=Pecten maximus TaxID=6579 RepID=UPI0014585B24|nr:LOW QUALITY PROTEIN: WD repeat-containing protein 54-like [Pecten maximus]